MIIAFCGHSSYRASDADEKRIMEILENRVGDKSADIYLGGYGEFDSFAHKCCQKYKLLHPNINLILVVPYLNSAPCEGYDATLYPELENVPPKFAITYRNRYIADRADLIIAYVNRTFGGAYTMYKYAQNKHKEVIDLAP